MNVGNHKGKNTSCDTDRFLASQDENVSSSFFLFSFFFPSCPPQTTDWNHFFKKRHAKEIFPPNAWGGASVAFFGISRPYRILTVGTNNSRQFNFGRALLYSHPFDAVPKFLFMVDCGPMFNPGYSDALPTHQPI